MRITLRGVFESAFPAECKIGFIFVSAANAFAAGFSDVVACLRVSGLVRPARSAVDAIWVTLGASTAGAFLRICDHDDLLGTLGIAAIEAPTAFGFRTPVRPRIDRTRTSLTETAFTVILSMLSVVVCHRSRLLVGRSEAAPSASGRIC
ncbi:MAG: hypothetical protein ABL959_14670 [Pyrinomonadaceae bacterium]